MRLFTDQVHRAQKKHKTHKFTLPRATGFACRELLLVDKTKRKDYILCAGEISTGVAPATEMAVNWLEKLCLKLEQLRYDSQTQAIGDQSEQRVHP